LASDNHEETRTMDCRALSSTKFVEHRVFLLWCHAFTIGTGGADVR
jgi:hypothetical protein